MSKPERYQEGAYWFSKLETYRTCPTLYKAKFIDKSLTEEMGLDAEFGTGLHLGLNDILSGGEGVSIFTEYWDMVDPALQKFKFDHKCLRYNGEVLLSRFARLHAKKFKPFMMEERIHVEIDGIKWEGTPDYLGDYDGIPSIVDFKTSSKKYESEKILCEEQLSGYAEMATRKLKYTPKQRVYYVFVKDFKEPSIQVLKSELTDIVRCSTIYNMSATVREIEGRKEFTRNTSNCVRGTIVCPNFDKCWRNK